MNPSIQPDGFRRHTRIPSLTSAPRASGICQRLLLMIVWILLGIGQLSAQEESPLTYSERDGEITVTKCDEDVAGPVVIPEEVDGMPVTGVQWDAFRFCRNVTSVFVPGSMKWLGGSSFFGCSSLVAFEVASGNERFSSVDGVLFDAGETRLLRYPPGKAGPYEIPNTVTDVAAREWYGGGGAFEGCAGLTEILISASVGWIGDGVFSGCRSLEAINVAPGHPNLASLDGVLFDDTMTSLLRYPEGKPGSTYAIPHGVSWIYSDDGDLWASCGVGLMDELGAFANCDQLRTVIVPENGTNISDSAFQDCDGPIHLVFLGAFPRWFECEGCWIEVPEFTIGYVDGNEDLIPADLAAATTKKVDPTAFSGYYEPRITNVWAVDAAHTGVSWHSKKGFRYFVETSPDLLSWTELSTLVSTGYRSTAKFGHSLGAGTAFFRVREEVLFQEDFEGGLDGWTFATSFDDVNWELVETEDSLNNPEGRAAGIVLADGDVGGEGEATLRSPLVDLGMLPKSAVLNFRYLPGSALNDSSTEVRILNSEGKAVSGEARKKLANRGTEWVETSVFIPWELQDDELMVEFRFRFDSDTPVGRALFIDDVMIK